MKKMNKKAFTLIELLVVVAVIGILVLLGMPRFIGYTEKAELRRIQHDVKVMEQEVGTVFVSNGDDNGDEFNSWEDNSKDLSQLAKENKLFEKEGIAEAPIGGQPYKVIPEKYKDKINTKLKGTFYANKDGKVYYEHEKPLFGIPAKSEEENNDGIVCYVHEKPLLEITIEEPKEKEPEYSDEEIQGLIAEGYIPVATADELNNVRNATSKTYGKGTKWKKDYTGGLDKKYVQVANIDLSGYSEEGWTPIGTGSGYRGTPFRGTYDGGNYDITNLEVKNDNLEVKNDNDNYQGLFGSANGAAFSNIGLIDNKATGSLYNQYTGGLVGYASSITISNSYATGSITGTGIYVGGLVGYASGGTISNSYTTGDVTGVEEVGGLVGNADGGTINNSYATGSVTGTRRVGGLVGHTSGYDARGTKISNSYATGDVTVASIGGVGANRDVGGLVGEADGGIISNSYSTASVETAYSGAGGLVGRLNSGAKVTNTYATGSITFTRLGETNSGGAEMGGLVGDAFGTIENSYATGDVTGNGKVGGLVGALPGGSISNSYATGSVTGISGTSGTFNSGHRWYTGGLVGWSYDSTIENSYATGSVEGRGPAVGGLVGAVREGTIGNSFAEGSVRGSRNNVGGLVGRAYRTNISNSSATGSVTGTGTGFDLGYTSADGGTGGLVGYANDITIDNSCAAGSVEGTRPAAGGLVGEVREGTIGNSFAEGSVKGTEEVGGLVGKAIESTTISNSYARGLVTGTNEVGGLVGLVEDSTISTSYWDKKTTKQTTSAGQDELFGKTTEEMKNQTTYSGWDFTNIWEITPGNYPTLR